MTITTTHTDTIETEAACCARVHIDEWCRDDAEISDPLYNEDEFYRQMYRDGGAPEPAVRTAVHRRYIELVEAAQRK